MKINNKKVTGIYKYNTGLEFTENDIVVSDSGKLYVCRADTTGEEVITDTDYFYPYLIGDTATLLDYITESNSGSYSLKLLTPEALFSILNYYNTGLDGNGIIGGYFDNSSYTYATSSVYGDQLLDNQSCLFRLMIDPHVNNGVFKVHRSLPELEGFINSPSTGQDVYVILRQYTYKSGDNIYRILEVIDHVTPTIIYRYCRLSDTSTAPTFLLAFIGEDLYIKKLQSAITITRARIKELDDTKAALINNFRFKNISFSENYIFLQLNDNSSEGYIENLNKGILVTLLITTKTSPKTSYSITILTSNPDTYYVDDSVNVVVENVEGDTPGIKISLTNNSYYSIQSAYYQLYYQ